MFLHLRFGSLDNTNAKTFIPLLSGVYTAEKAVDIVAVAKGGDLKL